MEYLPFVCRITNVKVLGKEFSSELQPVSVQRVFIVSCAVYLLSFSYELNSVECGRKGHNIGYKGLPPKNKESTEDEEENSKSRRRHSGRSYETDKHSDGLTNWPSPTCGIIHLEHEAPLCSIIIITTLCSRELGQRLKILCKPVGLHSDVEERKKNHWWSMSLGFHLRKKLLKSSLGEASLWYLSSGTALLLLL